MLGRLGLAPLGIGAWLSLKNTLLPLIFYLTKFRHSKSNRFGVHVVPKILWTPGTTILGQGRDCPIRNAPVRVCYLIKFHHSKSNRSGVRRGSQNFSERCAPALNNGNMVDPKNILFTICVTVPNYVIRGQTVRV